VGEDAEGVGSDEEERPAQGGSKIGEGLAAVEGDAEAAGAFDDREIATERGGGDRFEKVGDRGRGAFAGELGGERSDRGAGAVEAA
jgi:hypothetical protein